MWEKEWGCHSHKIRFQPVISWTIINQIINQIWKVIKFPSISSGKLPFGASVTSNQGKTTITLAFGQHSQRPS
jgi:hypothetical protein